ncbi:MAG: 4Fe-4S dicluster domain-containing protein [Thermoprotei archaeon]|nr:MAG: 4Fe-4S dicluster domain-containing protein [Thermoprotei archaeon]
MSGQPQMIWIVRDFERCSGCRLCELACSLKHEGEVWPEASRIRVIEVVPGITIPHLCTQCPDYPCVSACPFNALSVDKSTGAVVVDEGKCTACGKCVDACPGKIPRIVKGKPSVIICDLCGGDPECVKACEKAGFGALKVIPRPEESTIMFYARTPKEAAKLLVKKLYGINPEEVM